MFDQLFHGTGYHLFWKWICPALALVQDRFFDFTLSHRNMVGSGITLVESDRMVVTNDSINKKALLQYARGLFLFKMAIILFQEHHFLGVSVRSRDQFREINTTGKSTSIPFDFVSPVLELLVNEYCNIPSCDIINQQRCVVAGF